MAPKFHLFIALGFLTFTACINKDHYTLGPIEDLDSSYLPRGMLPAEKSKARDEAQTMVLWILSKNIEKTKSDPPAMLRGLAYLEYVYNDFLGDFQTAVPTKKSIKKIIISTRDALGIPLHLSPRKTINLYWSTAKLMEINKFSKSELSQSMTATLEKLSEVKSAINLAIIQAKLNMILARNEKFFSEKSVKQLTFDDIIYADEKPIKFANIRTIATKNKKLTFPESSIRWSKDLQKDLKTIENSIKTNMAFFEKSIFQYEKDLFTATANVFFNITKEDQDSWFLLQKLQKLADFIAISSLQLVKTLVMEKKENSKIQTDLMGFTSYDLNYLRQFLLNFKEMKTTRLKTFQVAYRKKSSYLIPAIQHLNNYNINLDKLLTESNNIPIDQIASLSNLLSQPNISSEIETLSGKIIESSKDLGEATQSINAVSSELSYAAGQYLASIGADLQTAADSIASAIQSGVSADLNAVAQGMGFGSFADAVAAYNAQYGTTYTEQQARDALAGN